MKHSIKVCLGTSKYELKPIRLRVSFLSQRVDLNSGISYEEKNFKNGRAKNNTRNANRQTAVEVNLLLSKQIEVIDNYFIECDLQKRYPQACELKRIFAEKFKTSVQNNVDVFSLFDTFIKKRESEKQLTMSCVINYIAVKRQLQAFNAKLTLRHIHDDFLNEIKAFFEEKQLKNRTIKHYLSMLNTFLMWLKQNKYLSIDIQPQNTVKIIKNDTQSYLTHSELKQFYEYKPENDTENLCKDLFLFAAFSGLRFSDLIRLKKIDIHLPTHFCVITKKTSTSIKVELNRYTREIAEKYFFNNEFLTTLFPTISIKHYNNTLHEIFKKCGVNSDVTITYYQGSNRVEVTKKKYEILSSHSARRTFVVECLSKGIPPLTVIRWTGHSNLETLRPYIAIADETKKKEMQKLDSEL